MLGFRRVALRAGNTDAVEICDAGRSRSSPGGLCAPCLSARGGTVTRVGRGANALLATGERLGQRHRASPRVSARALRNSPLVLEASVGYGRYRIDSGQRRHLLVAEAQVQVQTGGNQRAQLFAGVGGGLGVRRSDSTASHPRGTFPVNLTFSASAGGRLLIAQNWGAVGELRLRRITLFRGWTRELTVGLFVTL